MKYTIKATIPTGAYANLQPEITVEAETFEEAQAQVMPHIEKVWAQYGEKPLVGRATDSLSPPTKQLTDFFGNKILYDEVNHVYSWEGEVYESGSQYANKFRKPFDKQKIAKAMADKVGAKPEDILAMWELKAETSRDFGNAIHKALQLYAQYGKLATSLNKTTHSHDHPVIKKAVDSFMDAHKGETSKSEVLVVDHKNKRAGQIDRLLVTATTYRVQDFKTNADIKKELDVYWKQLDFYTSLLEANGVKTSPPQIFHYDGSWTTYNKGDK